MTRHPGGHRRRVAVLLAVALAVSLISTQELAGDDRDLLRQAGGKPYLFVLLDTSASMTLDPEGRWLAASGDDVRSRLFQAKHALYEALHDVTDVHVGLATLNQDRLRVRAKHWLYRVDAVNAGLSIGYPPPGAELTLGAPFESPTPGVGGRCDAPLDLDTERPAIDRFPKLGSAGDSVTTLWIRDPAGAYRLRFSPASKASARPVLGDDPFSLHLVLEPVLACHPLELGPAETATVSLRLVTQFLLRDRAATTSTEPSAGAWRWSDAVSDTSCSTGAGWESNYDSASSGDEEPLGRRSSDSDTFCAKPGRTACRDLLRPTEWSSEYRELDRGDVLPLDWHDDSVDRLLARLAPNIESPRAGPAGRPEFRAAPFFSDRPDPATGHLALLSADRRPILPAVELSPLARALRDFVCWYRPSGDGSCSDPRGATGSPSAPSWTGWADRAADRDPVWPCHRLYFVLVTDGGNDCPEPAPCDALAALRAATGARTWAFQLSPFAGAFDCSLHGDHETVRLADGEALTAELRRVVAQIRDEASPTLVAAAPPLQTGARDVSYLASFEPIAGSSQWRGHLEAFRNPLPRDSGGRPDRDSDRYLWDAGDAILTQAPTREEVEGGKLHLGDGARERRIFYSRLTLREGEPAEVTRPGHWPAARRLLDRTDATTGDAVRRDLWTGLDLPLDPSGPSDGVESRANQAIGRALAIQEIASEAGESERYLLGDIFHSLPLVVANPSSEDLLLADTADNGAPCDQGNPGYRCFAERHRFRRRIVVAGANDGMLHLFDGGLAHAEGDGNTRYGVGSGRELAAYIPRSLLPMIRARAEGGAHRFGVDASAVAADVFIDPLFRGAPDPEEREFRTVVVAGLREGGGGYLALDVTQPDRLDAGGRASPVHGYVPSCLGTPLELDPTSLPACGPIPWPAALWEFTDRQFDPWSGHWLALDEDRNGQPDLADTWSTPTIGRIRLCEARECDATGKGWRDRWVVVFGGGMDRDNKSGNWLYMLDVETGLPIYKRRVTGAVPAGVAAVDTNHDGYLDRLYAATLAGLLYRVDLESRGATPPRLVEQTAHAIATEGNTVGRPVTVHRIPLHDSDGRPLWEPRIVFDAKEEANGQGPMRPIFQRPTVLLVGGLGRFALAFGTGNRDDIWSRNAARERFYLFVDDTRSEPHDSAPLTAADLVDVGPGGTVSRANLLTSRASGTRGWYVELDEGERVISPALALSGLTSFTTFTPALRVSEAARPRCTRTGTSRLFVLNTTNGSGLLASGGGPGDRYVTIPGLAGPVVAEAAVAGRGESAGPGEEGGDSGAGGPLPAHLQEIMERLARLQPAGCRFASYRIDLKVAAAGVQETLVAPIPVCILQRGWREHYR